MPSEKSRGICPSCAEPNSFEEAHCRRCGFRLPWADLVEGVPSSAPGSSQETALDRKLWDWGMLKDNTVTCRFCHREIEFDTKQCPHCQSWLVGVPRNFYKGKDFQSAGANEEGRKIRRVVEPVPRAGCFAVLSVLVVLFWLGAAFRG